MGWKIQELSDPLHDLRKMTWVKLGGLFGITLPANGTMKNGSFIFCPTIDVVPWWQAMRLQIFIVVLEMPPSVSPENVWLRFQICQKYTGYFQLQVTELSEEVGWREPTAFTGNFQPSNQQLCKFLIFCRVFFKWSRHLKGGNMIHKWGHRAGESQRCIWHMCPWLDRERERRLFRTKRKLSSVCFFLFLSTTSHPSFECNHFVNAKDIKNCLS